MKRAATIGALLSFSVLTAAAPTPLWADGLAALDCGTGLTWYPHDGTPRTCSASLSGGDGTATIEGYADPGTLFFGTSLSITADNYFPPVDPGSWWNVLAQAGWEETITFYGPGMGIFLGALELTYEVSGDVAGDFPIRGILRIQGPTWQQDRYLYMNAGQHEGRRLTNTIPFTFGVPQLYGAWIRSDLLMEGQALTGSAYADFAHTATLASVRVLDANGVDVTSQVTMVTAQGDNDPFGLGGTAIAEPPLLLLLGAGLIGVARATRHRFGK